MRLQPCPSVLMPNEARATIPDGLHLLVKLGTLFGRERLPFRSPCKRNEERMGHGQRRRGGSHGRSVVGAARPVECSPGMGAETAAADIRAGRCRAISREEMRAKLEPW